MACVTDTLLPSAEATPATVLDATAEVVAGLVGTLWAARSPEELVATVESCERLRSALDAVLLGAVAEIDATRAASVRGWASTPDFLTAVTGGAKGSGGKMVRLARALTGDRQATWEGLGLGHLSRAQAEVVVGSVDRLPVDPGLRDAAEQLLLGVAVDHDASDLARAGRRVVERLDPDGSERADERALRREERAAHLGRFLSLREDGIGGVRISGRGTVEDAAWVKVALFALAAPQPTGGPGDCGGTPGVVSRGAGSCGVVDCAHDGRDPREHGARMWDALVDTCRRSTTAPSAPRDHGATTRVAVTIDLAQLLSGLGSATLETGGCLSAGAVRRLACDAELLPVVLGGPSQLLDVGRSRRLVTTGLWHALVVRDRHCAFPGCSRVPAACDAHHVVHWVHGGSTALGNLVLLCRTHHTMVHDSPWEVRIDPDDDQPEFVPPPALDPSGTPRRRQPLRRPGLHRRAEPSDDAAPWLGSPP